MLQDLMLRYVFRRFVDVLMLIVTLAIIIYCFWAFMDVIAPYQAMYQLSRG